MNETDIFQMISEGAVPVSGGAVMYLLYTIKQALQDLRKELHETNLSVNKLTGRVAYIEGRLPPKRRFDDHE